jgi:hypothetical protein
MEQSTSEFTGMKQFRELFCKMIVYPVIAKHPKQDKSKPLTRLYISIVNCVVFFCLRKYIPNEVFLFYVLCQNFYTFPFHAY